MNIFCYQCQEMAKGTGCALKGVCVKESQMSTLMDVLLCAVRGMAVVSRKLREKGRADVEASRQILDALFSTITNANFDDEAIQQRIGDILAEVSRSDISALDKADASTYGNPEAAKVNIGVRNRPGILVSGHDLKDLEELLEQTAGLGIDVYTHSEMLPAYYYPAFKKYPHFVGNYGNAWWKQSEEFETFNGVFLFTTNCIVPPLKTVTYLDRVYTTNSAGLPGATHIPPRKNGKPKDFSELIAHATRCMPPQKTETGEVPGGFARHQVMALADRVVGAPA